MNGVLLCLVPMGCPSIHTVPRYKRTKYNHSEDQMKKYTTLMSAYGVGVGIDFKFQGTVANTLSAHRLIQHFQEEVGPETADKIVNSLYKQYFEEEAHPAAPTTLLKAALDGGVERSKAEAFVGDEYEALPETKLLIREQASNGVEYVILEAHPFWSKSWPREFLEIINSRNA